MLVLIFPVILIFILTAGGIWWYQNYSRVAKHIKNIPGPKGYPVLGVFTDYLSDLQTIFQNDRDRSKKYFPIYKLWIFYESSVLLLHPDDIEVVLSSTKHIGKSKIYDLLHMWLGTGLLTSTGLKWKMRRKMLTPAFHFTILKEFVALFSSSTNNLLKNIKDNIDKNIDITPLITDLTMQSMAETSMGINLNFENSANTKYKEAFFKFTENSILRLNRPWLFDDKVFSFTSTGKKVLKSVETLHRFTKNIIKERKEIFRSSSYSANKRLAMLDLLLKIQNEEGAIDDEGIREEVDTFMFEGHDTTAVALCYILLLLANHEKIQEDVHHEIMDVIGNEEPTYNKLQELKLTERCIKESLRLYPSVVMIGRNIHEDLKIPSGYTIPSGSMAHIFIFDLHRRPEFYPDPLKFDPNRFLPENSQNRHPFSYIPFSAGPRNCIGQRFALLELKTVVCKVLQKFVLKPVDKPEDLVFQADLVLRSKNPIRIKFETRKRGIK